MAAVWAQVPGRLGAGAAALGRLFERLLIAAHRGALRRIAARCGALRRIAVHCGALRRAAAQVPDQLDAGTTARLRVAAALAFLDGGKYKQVRANSLSLARSLSPPVIYVILSWMAAALNGGGGPGLPRRRQVQAGALKLSLALSLCLSLCLAVL